MLAGGQAESQRDMRLTGGGVAEQQHVLVAHQELTARQFQHHRLVERRHGEEVEAVQAFGDRELGLPDTAFDGPALPIQQLQFCHPQEIARVVDILDRALPRHPIVLAHYGRQTQPFI